MGYLDNSSITVDAILTKRGRELLSRNDGSFRITQFALGDDEIDYTLFNINHPNGSQFSGEAIENMPLIEAIPNGANIMNSKLITLTRGVSAIPYIQLQSSTLSVDRGGTISLNPNTFNLGGNNQSSVEEYIFTILDDRLADSFIGQGGSAPASAADISEFSSIARSFSVRGASLSAVATTSNDLFGASVTSQTTSIIIEGVTSGAIKSVALTINK